MKSTKEEEYMTIEKKKMVLPLLCSPFQPGEAEIAKDRLTDKNQKGIAQAELFYFSGNAEVCAEITKEYIEHEEITIRLAACILYCFSNLTCGEIEEAKKSVGLMKECLQQSFVDDVDMGTRACCVFAMNLSTVLLHIPADNLPKLEDYMKYLPMGMRLYAMYIMAHEAYLSCDYERALGMAQSALLLTDEIYPIPMVYLQCLISMCYINLKNSDQARNVFQEAWKMARKDKFLEPFIEHHGLFQGMVESCVRKSEPQLYKKLVNGVLAFSRGWMKIHNPTMNNKITELLTPMEYSIAMLACRDWTNQEIGDYLELSTNTVKHYVSRILEKLGISKREQIKEYVNQ